MPIKDVFQLFRDLFIGFIPIKASKKYKFAFLVHPRDITDVYRKFPFAKKLPKSLAVFYCKYAWPIVVSKITGLKSQKTNKEIQGLVISIPMTAKQMMENRDQAVKKIIRAIKMAEKWGVKLVGLGALTASVTEGGRILKNRVNKVNIINSNSLVVSVAIQSIKKILKLTNRDIKNEKIAVIGATGSIGKAISMLLLKENIDNFLAVGRTKEHLEQFKNGFFNANKIKITNDISQIKNATLIIVATNASEAFINSDLMRDSAIIYDVTQPQNIDKDILRRNDVLVIDGGIVEIPKEINIHFNLGLPKQNVFACLAETMILAAEDITFGLFKKEVDIEGIKFLETKMKEYNFKIAPFLSFGKASKVLTKS